MKLRYLFQLIIVIALGNLASAQLAQKKYQPDDPRDAFLVSRQKAGTGQQNKPSRPAGARQNKPKPQGAQTGIGPLGIGYTLYQRDATGQPLRVSSAKEFRKDDAVRLVIESNATGYLYIFHVENDGAPQMIFPDVRLSGGDNRIAAHVPQEIPSSRETDPRLRWFVFDEKAATERLYVVVAKQPLPNIPTGKSLMAYCQANSAACPWRPAETNWKQVAANADAPVSEKSSTEFGQALTAAEAEALERGLGLKLDAPAPAVIRISQSPQAKVIAAVVALNHK